MSEWLEGPELVGRIGQVAGSGRAAMATGVGGITLALVMPDFEARMSGLARNVGEQRIALAMAVLVKA